MAKNKSDIIVDNLKGFIRKGASSTPEGYVPTGHFSLDFVINHGELPEKIDLSELEGYDPSENLGIPLGKLVMLYGEEGGGKSSIAYRISGYAQKLGYPVAWLDTEHSFAENLAKINGVDVDELYYSTMSNPKDPDKVYFAEDVFDSIIELIKSGVKVIILDSVANLVPKERMEGSAEKIIVGKLARLMSENLGKLVAYAAKFGTLLVFINQLRFKIGIMFGCFHYNSRVVLSDGTTKKIGTIVNNKLDLEVMSYNPDTGDIEPKKIIDWHDNGSLTEDECFLNFVVEKHGGNGRTRFSCTPNHKIFVPESNEKCSNYSKTISAGDLEIGDEILVSQPYYLNDVQRQIVYGSILGDGNIRPGRYNSSCSNLRIGHGREQKDYCHWKQEILEPWIGYSKNKEDRYDFETIPMLELTKLQYSTKYITPDSRDPRNKEKIIPDEIIDNLGELGLAIWYLDDGTFGGHYSKWGNGKSTICCIKFSNRDKMMKTFDKFGLCPKLKKVGFFFNSEDTRKLHSIICKYVPPCMEYKIHPNFRGKYDFDIDDQDDNIKELRAISAKIIDIHEKAPTRTKKKFDLTIEDNASYIVDGAIVHNSPETTPGGMSLKHNSSLIIKITKKKSRDAEIEIPGEDGKMKLIGRKSYMKVEKNRFAKPCFENIEVPIYYMEYFPNIEEIMFETGRQLKVISVRKGVFKWTDQKGEKHEAEGRSDFIEHIKYNELRYSLAKHLYDVANESETILPPEIVKWLKNHEVNNSGNNDDEKPTAEKETAGSGEEESTQSGD